MKRRDFLPLFPRAIATFCFGSLASVHPARAVDLDVASLLKGADRARGGGLPGIVWKVEVETTRGDNQQKRVLMVKAKGQDSLVEFLSPAKVSGQKLLSRGRSLWFIRPGLQKPVSISPRQRLLGDAANGDIAATNYGADYAGKLVGEQRLGDQDCYVLELSAKEKNVTYDKVIYSVSKSKQLGVKAEFYSVSGKLFKTASFVYENNTAYQGKTAPFVSTMTINDAIEVGASTLLRYRDVVVADLPASTFNLELLSR